MNERNQSYRIKFRKRKFNLDNCVYFLFCRILFTECVFIILEYLGMKFLDRGIDIYIILWESVKEFSIVVVPFTTPPAMWRNSTSATFSPTLGIVSLFNCSCSVGYELVPHYGFNLYSCWLMLLSSSFSSLRCLFFYMFLLGCLFA